MSNNRPMDILPETLYCHIIPVLLLDDTLAVSFFSSKIGAESDPTLSVGLAAMTPGLPAEPGLVGDISLAGESEAGCDFGPMESLLGMEVGSETAVFETSEKTFHTTNIKIK